MQPDNPSPDGVASSSRGGVVLVIDDAEEVRGLLTAGLGEEGYRVLTAQSGPEGLVLAERETPDLVVLDILMEPMDGWETLRLLRLELGEVPVVILSSRAEPRDKIRALQEGAVDYIAKPFRVREATRRLVALLRQPPEEDAG